jgi:NAD(P)-dependent dehydrogenase (short-subunit alcohol dehydrogenase family)
MKLKEKFAVATGGAQGIGEAIVRSYAGEGARVVIAEVAFDKAETLVSDIGCNGTPPLANPVCQRTSSRENPEVMSQKIHQI